MSQLPPLRGTPKQIEWAERIRTSTFKDKDSYGMSVLITAEKVDDATWWIANRAGNKLVTIPKDPAPHQVVGGTVETIAGRRLATHTGEYTGVPQQEVEQRVQRLLGEPVGPHESDDVEEPHEAELFAVSVTRHPALAEIAVLGLMAKLYTRAEHKKVGDTLKHRARCKLDGLRDRLVGDIDKDIEGLERILK